MHPNGSSCGHPGRPATSSAAPQNNRQQPAICLQHRSTLSQSVRSTSQTTTTTSASHIVRAHSQAVAALTLEVATTSRTTYRSDPPTHQHANSKEFKSFSQRPAPKKSQVSTFNTTYTEASRPPSLPPRRSEDDQVAADTLWDISQLELQFVGDSAHPGKPGTETDGGASDGEGRQTGDTLVGVASVDSSAEQSRSKVDGPEDIGPLTAGAVGAQDSQSRISGIWSKEEHAAYLAGLEAFPEGTPRRAHKISKHFVPSRTTLQVRTHHTHLQQQQQGCGEEGVPQPQRQRRLRGQKQDVASGTEGRVLWSEAEEAALLQGLEAVPEDTYDRWSRISREHIPSKTPVQIRSHVLFRLGPEAAQTARRLTAGRKSGQWSDEEIQGLMRGLEAVPEGDKYRWALISYRYVPTRAPLLVRKRYFQMLKRKSPPKGLAITPPIPPATSNPPPSLPLLQQQEQSTAGNAEEPVETRGETDLESESGTAVQRPGLATGTWSKEEHAAYLAGLEAFPEGTSQRFLRISKHFVHSRTAQQVRIHHGHLKRQQQQQAGWEVNVDGVDSPLARTARQQGGQWSDEEIQGLMRGLEAVPEGEKNRWARISHQFVPTRSPLSIWRQQSNTLQKTPTGLVPFPATTTTNNNPSLMGLGSESGTAMQRPGLASGAWSEQETSALLKGLEEFPEGSPRRFFHISRLFVPTRCSNSVCRKYGSMMRRKGGLYGQGARQTTASEVPNLDSTPSAQSTTIHSASATGAVVEGAAAAVRSRRPRKASTAAAAAAAAAAAGVSGPVVAKLAAAKTKSVARRAVAVKGTAGGAVAVKGSAGGSVGVAPRSKAVVVMNVLTLMQRLKAQAEQLGRLGGDCVEVMQQLKRAEAMQRMAHTTILQPAHFACIQQVAQGGAAMQTWLSHPLNTPPSGVLLEGGMRVDVDVDLSVLQHDGRGSE